MADRLTFRRVRLWQLNPRCRWCGVETVLVTVSQAELPDRKLPANAATIDHLRTKLKPEYRAICPSSMPRHRRQEPRTVLACYKCNQQRNKQQMTDLRKQKAKATGDAGGTGENR